MIEIRIVMTEHDIELEERIKQKIEPFCSSITLVEEHGDAGLLVSIIAVAIALPGFVVNVKTVLDWLSQKKNNQESPIPGDDLSKGKTNIIESDFEWKIVIQGRTYNLETASKRQRDELVEMIIAEHRESE